MPSSRFMLSITNDQPVLQQIAHRPWPMPNRPWQWYQEWNRVVFLHWKVPLSWLKPNIPKGLTIDTFEGACWISLVAFDMNKVRPRLIPAFSPLSDFYELNIRTYVTMGGKAGVYFLSIEAGNQLACLLARKFSGLPYQYSSIRRKPGQFQCQNHKLGNHFNINYQIGKKGQASPLDLWLTERYCLYHDISGNIFRYEVQHKPWGIYALELGDSQIQYEGYQDVLANSPDCCHYSPGVAVLAFSKEKINQNEHSI